jgi:hypothetical protein
VGDIGGRESRGEGEKGAREGGARRSGVGGRGLPGLRSLVLKGHGGERDRRSRRCPGFGVTRVLLG